MLKRIMASLALLMAAWIAFAPTVPAQDQAPLEDAPPENYNCAALLLMEPDSGQVIFEQNADEKRSVASVTKVMTILLTMEAVESDQIALTDGVVISPNAAGMGGSQALLDAGETQTVSELLKATIVGSANDASVALAEHIAGSVPLFVDRMNDRARALGMTNTCFVNATGLPAEGQHTTARDVSLMSAALSRHELYYDYSTIWLDEVRHESGRVTQLTNTNKLVRLYDGCDGLKTGSTNEAGYCVAASAKRGGMRLIAVVLGAKAGSERFDIASKMLDYGFASYRRYPVAEAGARVRGTLRVTGGARDEISLALGGDLTLLLKKGEEQKVTLTPNLPESVVAPVTAGDAVGTVDVLLDGKLVGSVRVTAAESVAPLAYGGALARLMRLWGLTGGR